jgi:radical SAM superfamily enzyme YgiQ (UPF0313 family)
MKESGCYGISIGVESGNGDILNKIKKGEDKKVINAFEILSRHKIMTLAHFMIGFPWDTVESVKETIAYANRLKCTLADYNILVPFPGTPIRKLIEKEGLLLNAVNVEEAKYQVAIIKTYQLQPEEMIRLRKKAINSYYINLRTLLNGLFYVTSYKQFKYCIKFMTEKFVTLFAK